jgi:hypothetical protein
VNKKKVDVAAVRFEISESFSVQKNQSRSCDNLSFF